MNFETQVGDIHVTHQNGVYLIWKLQNPRSRVWMPILDSRSSDEIGKILSDYRKIKDSDGNALHCGFYRLLEGSGDE